MVKTIFLQLYIAHTPRMNIKKLRSSMLVLLAVFIAALLNSRHVFVDPNVRTVDAISLISVGVVIGVFVVTAGLYFGAKNKQSNK